MKAILLSVLTAAILTACGGGGGGSSGTTGGSSSATLSGTAAGGAPLVGTVTVKDSLGNLKVVPIEADGSYNVDVTGMTGPFMLRASGTVGGTSVTYYSAATSADLNKTVNVTPFTTLIISNIAAKLAETYYNEGGFAAGVTAGSLDAAVSSLQQKLAPALQALGLSASIDLLRTSFAANHTGLDAALDLIKVSIDPNTNVATLTNALTNAQIGSDSLNDRSDDSTSATLSDAEKAALAAGKTDLEQVQTVLSQFAALFGGSTMPTSSQIASSGLFETGSGFIMSGANFAQFASDVAAEPSLLGVKVTGSDVVFSPTNPNAVRTIVQLLYKAGSTEALELSLARADANSPWKITGDGRLAEMEVKPLALSTVDNISGAVTRTSGVQLYLDADYYNSNHPGTEITAAQLSGPGITGNIPYVAQVGTSYLVMNGTQSNVIPECQGSQTANCINIGAMTDNAVYTVRLFAGTTPVNGTGDKFIISKKPVPGAQLTASMFPNLSSVTIDGAPVTLLSHFQANKNLSLAWAMPSGVYQHHVTVQFLKGINPLGSAGREVIEEDLEVLSGSTKDLALGSAPANATWANIWLSGRDIYGRDFVLSNQYRSN